MKKSLLVLISFIFISCNTDEYNPSRKILNLSSYAEIGKNFRLNLTDAPRDDVKSVFVNIKHVEIKAQKSGLSGDLLFAKNFGQVDLLTLRDGVLLPMQDVQIPHGVSISQIRFVLESHGNYLIMDDESTCDLKTPSQQQSGLKIKMNTAVVIEQDYSYSLTVDFDALKSVVFQGNGGCLLKPVLKVSAFTSTPIENVNGDGGSDGPEYDVSDTPDNTDPNIIPNLPDDSHCDDIDYDPYDPATWPEDVTWESLAVCF